MTSLSPERWRQVDELYAAALALEPGERDPFLRANTHGDAELAEAVRILLASEHAADRQLGESAGDFAPALMADAQAALRPIPGRTHPHRVGPYVLLREIGRGGMGTVYLAERADAEVERRVALKLVKRGMDTDEILERFRYERRILASLEHPHIARLYDGGVSEGGAPYLVMEYVRGVPIDRYCDERRVAVNERLALFELVCEAVLHAHRKLVVHRDLKPSNILVAADGSPRLLDFGIARLLDERERGAPHTRTGMRVLTPEYAAPEQLRGEPVTVASDVYALGVILYRLLAGRMPYRMPKRSAHAAERATLDQDAERPSAAVARRAAADTGALEPTTEAIADARATTPEGLRRRLRGDLDSIVLKALEKDPARRYASVEQLLMDLRRHRAGRPVEAHAASVRYRAGKFVRRHRSAVAVVALIVLLLFGFAGAMMLQQHETAIERDTARRERDRAEHVVGFMTQMLGSASPGEARGTVPTVFDLLSRSEARLDTALAAQPDVQATLWQVIGRVYGSLGDYERARPALERALHLRREVFGEQSLAVAETVDDLATVIEAQGDYDASEPLRRLSLRIRVGALGTGDPAVATALHHLGYLFFRKGEYAEAEQHYARSVELGRRLDGQALVLATSLNGWGVVLASQGQWAEAETLFREALAIRRRELGDDHPLIPNTLTNLAALLRDTDRAAAAEPLFREAVQIRQRILPHDHPDLASSVIGLAYLLQKAGDLAGAEEMFRWSLDINRQKHGDQHPEVGFGMTALAGVLRVRGAHREAEEMLRTALDVLRSTLGERHARVSMPLLALGTLLVEAGSGDEAEALLKEALALRVAGLGESHFATTAARFELADGLISLHRYADAEKVLLEIQQLSAPGPDEQEYRDSVHARFSRLYTAWGMPERAAAYLTP